MKQRILILLLVPAPLWAQLTKQDSVWLPMTSLLGSWAGTGEGEPGKGVYERRYKQVLNKKYIEVTNKSTYPPKDKHPKGEVHEDLGYISYDRAKKQFIFRQFHVERFVIQYHLETISQDGRTLVFLSDSIENIPAGWRARETYQFGDTGHFTETFELAEPGKEFTVYTKVSFAKK